MFHPQLGSNKSAKFLRAVLAVAMAAALFTGHHAVAGPIGYSLKFASDKRLLQAPNNPNVRTLVAKQTKYDRLIGRAMPYYELANLSADEDLVRWQLTVGDVGFHFAGLDTQDPAGAVVSQSLVGLGTRESDVLTLNVSGLKPGMSTIGLVKIAPDQPTPNQITDFRNVLFEMNSASTPEQTQNAEVNVTFSSGSTLGGMLPNFTHEESVLGGHFVPCGNEAFAEQEVFEFTQTGETEVVPEPGTLALSGTGLVCWALVAWHRRRSRRRP